MNGVYGYYRDPLEAYDGDAPFDDESAETIAEFNPFGGIAAGIGNLLSGGSRNRVPLRHGVQVSTAPGVRDATLNTPRGSAQLKLPEEVVTKREFEQATQHIQEGVNKVMARVNTIEQQDLPALKKEVGTIIADTRKAVADERTARQKELSRLREEQKSQQSMNSMFNLILLQRIQKQLASHHHPATDDLPAGSSGTKADLTTDDSKTLLLLPMLGAFGPSGSSSSAGGMDPMMMIMLMFALQD